MTLADALLRAMRPASGRSRTDLAAAVKVAHPKATPLQIDRAFRRLARRGLSTTLPDGLLCC